MNRPHPTLMTRRTESRSEQHSYSVRKAASQDRDAILSCLAAAFGPYRSEYTPGAFADTVLKEETVQRRVSEMCVFVAVSDGEVVGTIACTNVSSDEGHLRGMAVLPQRQGTGVALALLEAAEAELRRRGCKRVTLDTTEPLTRAIRFYEKNGYFASGRVSDFFGMPLYEYAKSL